MNQLKRNQENIEIKIDGMLNIDSKIEKGRNNVWWCNIL